MLSSWRNQVPGSLPLVPLGMFPEKDKRLQTPHAQEQHTVLSVRQTQGNNMDKWHLDIDTHGAQQ